MTGHGKGRRGPGGLLLAAAALALAAACGPTDAEIAKDRRIDELQTQLQEVRGRKQTLDHRLDELKQQNDALSRLVLGLTGDVDQLQADRAGLRESLEGAQGALDELGEELQQTEREEQATRERLAEAQRALEELRERERQARKRLATFRSMLRQFEKMIEAGDLRVRVVRNRMVVELPEAVLFETGRAKIEPRGEEVLTKVAEVLAQIEEREFQVAGHTDDVPIRTRRYPSNWELSTARAVNVVHFLEEQGVPEDRLAAAGYADTEPVASNETEEGRRRNRRVEIVLMPNLEELPDLSSLEEATGG